MATNRKSWGCRFHKLIDSFNAKLNRFIPGLTVARLTIAIIGVIVTISVAIYQYQSRRIENAKKFGDAVLSSFAQAPISVAIALNSTLPEFQQFMLHEQVDLFVQTRGRWADIPADTKLLRPIPLRLDSASLGEINTFGQIREERNKFTSVFNSIDALATAWVKGDIDRDRFVEMFGPILTKTDLLSKLRASLSLRTSDGRTIETYGVHIRQFIDELEERTEKVLIALRH